MLSERKKMPITTSESGWVLNTTGFTNKDSYYAPAITQDYPVGSRENNISKYEDESGGDVKNGIKSRIRITGTQAIVDDIKADSKYPNKD